MAPYQLTLPEGPAGAVVFSSPHSGDHYPARVRRGLSAGPADPAGVRGCLCRPAVFAAAPSHGAPLLAAVYPRAWIDLNRGPSELDPALDRWRGVRRDQSANRRRARRGSARRLGRAARSTTARSRSPRPRHVSAEFIGPITAGWINLWSLPATGTASRCCLTAIPCRQRRCGPRPRVRGRVPDIVLGDRFGAAAARHLVAGTQEAFEAEGLHSRPKCPVCRWLHHAALWPTGARPARDPDRDRPRALPGSET